MKSVAQVLYRRLRATSALVTPSSAELLLGTEVSGLALDFVTNTYANRVVNGTDDPIHLFKGGEQGIMLDPSDITTLFQDAAGTTPLTNVEQPVGLALDKRLGLVPGSELVTNGDFSNGTTGWAASGALPSTATVVDGEFRVTATVASGRQVQAITCEVGKTYVVTGRVRLISGTGSAFITLTPNSTGSGTYTSAANNTSTFIETRSQVVATATEMYVAAGSTGGQGVTAFDNISVRELPGNHAFQTTSTARPILSARYNQLVHTEAFDNAAWSKENNGLTTADTLVDNGTLGRHIVYQTLTGDFAVSRKFSVEAKQNTLRYLVMSVPNTSDVNCYSAIFDLQTGGTPVTKTNGTGTISASITPKGDGWYLCSITGVVATSGSGSFFPMIGTSDRADFSGTLIQNNMPSYSGTGKSLFIRKADLRVANDGVNLPPYQRVGAAVNASTNPSVTGVPDYDAGSEWPRYFRCDGVDDGLVTGTINFTGTDKMSVFAAVRKLNDTAAGVIAELSADASTNNGAFVSLASTSVGDASRRTFGGNLRGTADLPFGAATFTSPTTAVLTQSLNIAGAAGADEATQRVNGAATTLTYGTADAGTGAFGNYPLYIGSRGGSLLYFNGRIYGLIVLGRLASPVEIAAVEAWLNGKAKVYA